MRQLKLLIIFPAMVFLFAGCDRVPSITNNVPSTGIPNVKIKTITVKNETITVDYTVSPSEKAKGLSGRDSMPENSGMIFDFSSDTYKQPEFWMKDMKFGLDLIWIQSGKIIGITKNVPAPTSPNMELRRYHPPGDIDYVLEMNAGWSDRHSIAVNDSVKF